MDSLDRPLDLFNVSESLWNDKCNYLDTETCKNFNPNSMSFIVLQLNVRSLLSHQSDLRNLLHELDRRNSTVDILLLCETFLNKKTERMVNIPGYTLLCNSCLCNKGGGTCILVCSNIKYNKHKDLEVNVERKLEITYIEVTAKSGQKFRIGSLYRAPNTNPEPFSSHVHNIADTVHAKKGNKSLILGMDHNMDLLMSACHHATSNFLDGLVNREIYPTITRPTHIMQTSVTLIDNVFVSKDLHKSFDSGILSDISDHFLSLVLLKQNKLTNKEPLEFLSRNLTEAKISHVKNELNKVDWNGVLNSDDAS